MLKMNYKLSIMIVIFICLLRQAGAQEYFVFDSQGNRYKTVQIGKQVWMAENLRSTMYRDGKPVLNVTGNADWTKQTGGAYCWYENDSANYSEFGALYNWYAVNTDKLCPKGWHVPSNAEWNTLIRYLGGSEKAGGKLKESDTLHWAYPNKAATNETGFTALASGGRTSEDGQFGNIWLNSIMWTSTEYNQKLAWFKNISKNYPDLFSYCYDKRNGFSVRCVKN